MARIASKANALTKDEAAAYIVSMCAGLTQIADAAGLPTVSYFLKLTGAEAASAQQRSWMAEIDVDRGKRAASATNKSRRVPLQRK